MHTVGDDIQRGLHNTFVNWPLVLIGVGVQWFLGILLVVSIIAALVPLVVAGVLSASFFSGHWNRVNAETFIFDHPIIAMYIVLVIGVVLIPLTIVYSFAQGGRCGIFIDAEARAESMPLAPTAERWAAFDFSRWATYGQKFWWRIFLIYNVTWGVFSLLLIVIVALAAGSIWYLFDRSADALLAGCAIASVGGLLLLIGMFLTAMWTEAAIIACIRSDAGAAAATRQGLSICRARFGRFIVLQLLLIGISVSATVLLLIIYSAVALVDAIPGMVILLLPLKIAGSLAHTALGALLGNWYNAAFVSAVQDETALVRT